MPAFITPEKFCILDGTKHNPENFGIFAFHHSKVVGILQFAFHGELNRALKKYRNFVLDENTENM